MSDLIANAMNNIRVIVADDLNQITDIITSPLGQVTTIGLEDDVGAVKVTSLNGNMVEFILASGGRVTYCINGNNTNINEQGVSGIIGITVDGNQGNFTITSSDNKTASDSTVFLGVANNQGIVDVTGVPDVVINPGPSGTVLSVTNNQIIQTMLVRQALTVKDLTLNLQTTQVSNVVHSIMVPSANNWAPLNNMMQVPSYLPFTASYNVITLTALVPHVHKSFALLSATSGNVVAITDIRSDTINYLNYYEGQSKDFSFLFYNSPLKHNTAIDNSLVNNPYSYGDSHYLVIGPVNIFLAGFANQSDVNPIEMDFSGFKFPLASFTPSFAVAPGVSTNNQFIIPSSSFVLKAGNHNIISSNYILSSYYLDNNIYRIAVQYNNDTSIEMLNIGVAFDPQELITPYIKDVIGGKDAIGGVFTETISNLHTKETLEIQVTHDSKIYSVNGDFNLVTGNYQGLLELTPSGSGPNVLIGSNIGNITESYNPNNQILSFSATGILDFSLGEATSLLAPTQAYNYLSVMPGNVVEVSQSTNGLIVTAINQNAVITSIMGSEAASYFYGASDYSVTNNIMGADVKMLSATQTQIIGNASIVYVPNNIRSPVSATISANNPLLSLTNVILNQIVTISSATEPMNATCVVGGHSFENHAISNIASAQETSRGNGKFIPADFIYESVVGLFVDVGRNTLLSSIEFIPPANGQIVDHIQWQGLITDKAAPRVTITLPVGSSMYVSTAGWVLVGLGKNNQGNFQIGNQTVEYETHGSKRPDLFMLAADNHPAPECDGAIILRIISYPGTTITGESSDCLLISPQS